MDPLKKTNNNDWRAFVGGSKNSSTHLGGHTVASGDVSTPLRPSVHSGEGVGQHSVPRRDLNKRDYTVPKDIPSGELDDLIEWLVSGDGSSSSSSSSETLAAYGIEDYSREESNDLIGSDSLSDAKIDESVEELYLAEQSPAYESSEKEPEYYDFTKPMKPSLLRRAVQRLCGWLKKDKEAPEPSEASKPSSVVPITDNRSVRIDAFSELNDGDALDPLNINHNKAWAAQTLSDVLNSVLDDRDPTPEEHQELEDILKDIPLEDLEGAVVNVLDANLEDENWEAVAAGMSTALNVPAIQLSIARRIIYSLFIRLGLQGLFLRKLLDKKELSSSELNQVKYWMNVMSFDDIKAMKDNDGRTILHCIARNGHIEALDALIEHFREEDGFFEFISVREDSPLVESGISLGNNAMMADQGTKDEFNTAKNKDKAGPTPFDVAIIRGHVDIARRLEDLGCKFDTIFLIRDSASKKYYVCTAQDAALIRLQNLKEADEKNGTQLATDYEEQALAFIRSLEVDDEEE